MSDLDESSENIQNNETLNKITTTQNTENPQENNKVLEVSMETKESNINIENSGEKSTTTVNETTTTTTSSNNNENNNCNNNNEQHSQIPPQPSTPLASDSPSTSTSSSTNNSPSKHKIFSVKDIGISYEKNPRYRRTMEDEHVIMDRFGDEDTSGFFAIYDGHGGRGAVEFTAKTLHNNLLDEIKKEHGDIKEHGENMLEALRESYLLTDNQMEKDNVLFSGTTAITALIRYNPSNERYLYVANAGDARAVVSEDNKAIRLSHDHKGSDQDEIKRISDAGGFVVNNRVNGILAVTRSLGDHSMKEYVVGDPYKMKMRLDSRHTHLILACDGLWDVTSDQDAIDLVLTETDAQKMSDKLLAHALKKGSTDNISIIVIIL